MGQVETHWLWKIKDMVSGSLDKIAASTTSADQKLLKIGNSVAKVEGVFDGLAGKMFKFNQIAQGLESVKTSLDQAIAPGAEFDAALKDLSAITDVTGEKLEKLGNNARKTNLQFGGGAAKQIESYKTLLSRLGPEIASSPAALESMGKSVAILSKTMSGDTLGSVNALTTGLLQFRVNLENPLSAAAVMSKQMNVMAAAAQQGAAEVPQISSALEQAGVSASNANVSFEETNALIQALAQGGKYGSEAGVALRNVMSKLEKGRFLPKETLGELKAAGVDISVLSNKTVPFTTRLRELNKIAKDGALVTQLFGDENSAAANILMRSVDYVDDLKQKITGTNVAVNQAKIVMSGFNERMLRGRAIADELAIRFFNVTQNALPFIQAAMGITLGLANAAPAMAILSQMTGWFTAKLALATTWLSAKAAALWTNTIALGQGALGMIRYGAATLWAGVTGIGSFIMNLLRGNYLVMANASFMLRYGVPALGRYMVAQARAGIGAIRMGAAFLWNSAVAMPAMIAGAVRMGAAFLWNATMALPGMIAGLGSAAIAQLALNAAMYANPVGVVILGLLAVGSAIALVINYWDEIKSALLSFGTWIVEHNPFAFLIDLVEIVFPGFKQSIQDVFMSVIEWFGTMWDSIKGVWNSITSFFGFDGGNVEVTAPDVSGGAESLMGDLAKTSNAPAGDSGITKGISDVSGGAEGGQVRNVKVHIERLIGIETLSTTNMQQGLVNLKEEIKRVVVEAIRDGEIILASE